MSDEPQQQNTAPVKDEATDWQAKSQEYLDGWKRAQADFINFKKDELKRVTEILQFGSEALVLEILDIADQFDTALAHIPPEIQEKHAQWSKGLEHIAKNIQEMLKRHGAERIKATGEKFDPLLHEAVQAVDPEKGAKSDTVAEEYRAGYTLHGKVIRPARVKVVK